MADTPATSTTNVVKAPPPPPRLTGVPEQDLLIVAAHLSEIYQNQYVNFLITKQVTGYDPKTFDASKLPDPAATTLGQAQKTANDAYALANSAQQSVANMKDFFERTKHWRSGTVKLTGTNNQQTYNFPADQKQPDTNYTIMFTSEAYNGSIPFGATQVIKYTKTVDGFTVTVNDAPGAGNDVTLSWHIRR